MLRNTITSFAPATQIIDVAHWDDAIHALQHNSVTALVAETPSFDQRSQTLRQATTLRSADLSIVLLDAEASAISTLTTAAFAALAKNSDELRAAVMDLGRDDIDDIGTALVVTSACITEQKNELCYT